MVWLYYILFKHFPSGSWTVSSPHFLPFQTMLQWPFSYIFPMYPYESFKDRFWKGDTLGHIQNTVIILLELPFLYLVLLLDIIIHEKSYFPKKHASQIMVLTEKKLAREDDSKAMQLYNQSTNKNNNCLSSGPPVPGLTFSLLRCKFGLAT